MQSDINSYPYLSLYTSLFYTAVSLKVLLGTRVTKVDD